MIINNNQNINAILVNNKFIKNIKDNKDNNIYNQTLSNLKLLFLDNFSLNSLDSIVLGD